MALLIIGVDPGTTLGYAIITDKGEFLTSGSGKDFSMSELISNIIGFGRPLIVGCDKNPPPWFAESLAVKLGAKLFYPREDLRVNEKREMVKHYDVKLNVHEMDALASAMFALGKHRNFFGKIERFLEQTKKQELEEAVKLIMIRNQDLPLEAALSMAEQKDKEKVVETSRQIVKEAEKASEKSSFSDKMLQEMMNKIVLLEEENREMRQLLKEKDGLLRRLSKRVLSGPKEELVDYKEQRIRHYTKQLKDNTRLVQHYEKEINRLDEFIARTSDGLLVKKLHDLGSDEYEHKRFLNIGEGDILLVENPGSISQKVIDELKGKVKVIITNNIPKKGMPGFALLKPEGAILKETKHFAIADKKSIDEALKNKDLLKDILDEYKQERKKEE